MALPAKKIKQVKLPNNDIYQIVPEMLSDGTYAVELPALTQDDTFVLSSQTTSFVSNNGTSTDNAVARFDGTSGKIIQNSNVTIADTGSITIGGTWTSTSANNPYISLGGYVKLTGDTSGAFTIAPNNVETYTITTTEVKPTSSKAGAVDLGSSSAKWRNLYLSGAVYTSKINNGGDITIPTTSGTMALTSDPHIKSASVSNKTLTLTKQDDTTVTFTDTDTWRAIKVAGTEKIGANSNTALDFLNTGNVQFTYNNGLIANVSGSVGNADTVDDLHMLDQTYAYKQKLTITVGCVDAVVNTGLTEAQIFALTGSNYGKVYLASDTGKYWRKRNTTSTASSANWRDDTTACTNSKALANQLTTEDAIYIKLDTKTPYYSKLPKFFVEASYDNTNGSTQVTGFCRQQNQFEFTACSYNGNNLVGVYQPTTNTNIYYFKFAKYRSNYGATASYDVSPVIYTNFNTNDAELTFISKNHPDYATVSGYSYISNATYGVKGTAIYYTLLPVATNTYDLGDSSHKWRNLYVGNNISDGTNAVTVANIAKKTDIKDSTITIKQNGIADQTFTLNASSAKTITLVDTTYENKSAVSGGTDVTLATTGEKYIWNNKQNALSTYSAYSNVGSSTKIPIITTNTYGQVTSLSTADVVSANDGRLDIYGGTTFKGSFTANQSTNASIYITAADLGLEAAMKFIGVSTTDPTSSSGATVSGHTTWKKGEIVIYKRSGESGYEEYIATADDNAHWELLGDADSYALKTVQISAGTGLTGGGTLESNRTISLSTAYGDTINPYGAKAVHYVLAGPSSGTASAVPTFRALVKSDIPALDYLPNTTAYLTSASKSGSTLTVYASNGGSYALTDTNTTYTFASGTTSGAFTVTPLGGSAQTVSIYGLKSNAYTDTPIPTVYLSSASVSGNTLTITPASGTAITFTPTFTDYNQKVTGNGVTFGVDDTIDIKGSGIVSVTGNSTAKTITISASHQSIKTLNTDNTTAQTVSSNEAIAGSGTINLHKVAKTGTYSDLIGLPTIPTVYNATLTVTQNDTSIGTFTANSSTPTTINVTTPQILRYI